MIDPASEFPADDPAFPAETEWLELPCPEISASFVEDTLHRVRRELKTEAGGSEADPDSIVLPRAVLAAFAVPPPSPDFVARTWSRVQGSLGMPAWQRALSGLAVPDPSPDFVDRVMRSLRVEEAAAVGPRRLHLRPTWRVAAAAALLLVGVVAWMSRPAPDADVPFEVLASTAFSPDPWAATLSSLNDRGMTVVPDDGALRLAELAGMEAGS